MLGILLTNIGTPTSPTIPAVRAYLKEFLSDKRVVELPRLIWWPILHGIILRTRPKKSAKLYQKIWTTDGSPLLLGMQNITAELQKILDPNHFCVVFGMHYGKPSIQEALNTLKQKQIQKLIILPLYPQYSSTTTASTFDQVTEALKTWRVLPELKMLNHYADHTDYIAALAQSIREFQQYKTKPDHLLFSFHGIPTRGVKAGDPYPQQCELTAKLVANALGLKPTDWSLAFQSRMRGKWLSPFTDKTLKKLPKQGVKNLHIICPGFAVDCLETLEEIAIRGQEQFLDAGGKEFHYIPSLNSNELHIDCFKKIINS